MRTATNGNISRQTELAPVPSAQSSGAWSATAVGFLDHEGGSRGRERKKERESGHGRSEEEGGRERERESLGEEEAREREGNGGDLVLHHQ